MRSHFVAGSNSLGLFPYDITWCPNWTPAANFAKKATYLGQVIEVSPAYTPLNISILLRKSTISVFLSSWFETIDFQSNIESCYRRRGVNHLSSAVTISSPVDLQWDLQPEPNTPLARVYRDLKRLTWSKHDIGAKNIIASILSKKGTHAAISENDVSEVGRTAARISYLARSQA